MHQKPHKCSKQILLAVSGMSPQSISKTIFALHQQTQPFIPTKIDTKKIVNALFECDYLAKLCADSHLTERHFSPDHIEIIQDIHYQDLDDIKTVTENEQAANFICQFVKKHTTGPDSAAHVFIAGSINQ